MASPPNATDRRSRGRPQRLPNDASPITSDDYEGNKRLAWLLATNRMLGPATKDITRSDFVTLMKQRGMRIDSSRISRWESGLDYISPDLVEAYEAVAGLQPAQIGAVRRVLARDGRLLTRSTDRHSGPADPELIDELIDGLEAGRIRGQQWIWLADQLRRFQTIYLHRRTWQDLADQLVDELARSSSIAYLARYEAAAALMKSPQAQPYLSKSVGRYVLDPQTQVITPVLQVLSEVAEAGASDVVLRLVGAPNVKLRRSAAIVAAAMIRRGNLAPHHKALERQVGRDLLRAPGRTSVVTLDLASRMTDEQFDRLHRSTTDEGVRSTLRQARATGELVDPDQARLLADHIGLHAELLCARASADPDQMLRRLIREALFHVHRSRRHLASALLLASPYAAAVGEVVLRLTSHADVRVSMPCWSLVGRMTPALSTTALTERVAAEDRDELQARAASALMWVGADMPEAAVNTLVEAVDSGRGDTAYAAVLALGLADRQEELAKLVESAPADLEPLVRWAAARGPAVTEV